MSRKTILPSFQIITNGDMSSSSITSEVSSINYVDNVFVQLNFTGTPTGTFSVQVSADYNPNLHDTGNWITLPVSLTATGSSGNIGVDFNQLGAPWLRIVYTRVSGSGTLNAYVTAKGV